MYNTLQFVLILLASAVLAVVVFRLLRLPPMLGYLLSGVIIGPHALGLIPDVTETHHLAEFGVVFLMFSIGLEFSLPKLITMKNIVFGFGTAQVCSSMIIVMIITWVIGIDWRIGLVLSTVLAMSSTAIVSKMLSEKLELNSDHGRQIIGTLLFQDLAVVLFLIVIPALVDTVNSSNVDLGITILIALLKAGAVLGLILFFGQRMMRPWFNLVARQKSSELFVLNVLFITLGLAWLTGIAGLSLALGAFLAGMLISETEYRHQVEDDIKPFRDILLGLFFVTIGMLLDIESVAHNFLWVLLLLITLIIIKASLISGLAYLYKSNSGVAIRTGLGLAQGGEFSFVLLAEANSLNIVDNTTMQPVLAAIVLSMLIAPFIIEYSENMAKRFSTTEWMNRAMQLTNIAAQTITEEQHVILCGYGRSGQNLSRLLEKESITFIALDLDPVRIRAAAAAGESVVYGDAARYEVLIAAGLKRAKLIVISYTDTISTLKVLRQVQAIRPELPVVVRTLDDSDIDVLKEAGAAEVVSEIMEGSIMLASHAFMHLGIPLNRVLNRMQETREKRYNLFRGFYHGISDEIKDSSEKMQLRLLNVMITDGSAAVGKKLGKLNLEILLVEVPAIRRRNVRELLPDQETILESGDILVLRGTKESLAAAEIKLLQG
tara:strand:- start:9203 stop:11185 length:1983 start_codon:yes stop_codon:yes gene_type:complete